MDIKGKVVDVSSFLLFEATGDSEAGCCFDPALSAINPAEDHVDDDDAESCSFDATSDDLLPAGVFRELNSLEYKRANVVGDDDLIHEDEEDGEVVDQQEVHNLYKKCRDDQRFINGVAAKEKKSSAVSVDSSMSEMEKNRLFWEACLAS
ncbi:hypothetical protein PTKIN_Ptkin12aG0128100 [Pterospermum kingtungense]